MYAGNPGKNKDKLNILIECLYQLKKSSNYTFFVIGITKEQYLIDFREHMYIIDELKDKVKFLGRLSHIESLKYVNTAEFSMFIRENTRVTKAGFPTKFVESMTCGTPVITTRTSDLENYILEGKNGFFIDVNNNKNTVSIFSKVLGMNREEIKIMKKNCKESKKFHYGNYIGQFEQFLNNI